MRTTKQLTLLLASLFMLASARGQDVHYNYDRGANFQSYRTYQWVTPQSDPPKTEAPANAPPLPANLPAPPAGMPALPSNLPSLPANLPAPSANSPNLPVGPSSMSGSNVSDDQLLDQDIRRAVDAQLAEKGLTKVDKGGDLLVGYQANVHEEKSINLSGSGTGGWGGGDPFWGGGFSSVQGQTSTIPIGTLVVGLYDPARKQLIWRGDASKTVSLKKDPNKNYNNLQKATVKLFKNYPPQPGK